MLLGPIADVLPSRALDLLTSAFCLLVPIPLPSRSLRLPCPTPCPADPAGLLEPSRAMSGWVAARVAGEEATRALFVDGAPGFLTSATGATIPANLSAAAAAVKLAAAAAPADSAVVAATSTALAAASGVRIAVGSATAAGQGGGGPTAAGVGGGASIFPSRAVNGGLPVGAGPIRLELSLRERIAALAARREERDKRSLALRRYYVAQLRNYVLETKVSKYSEHQGVETRRCCRSMQQRARSFPPLT